MLDLRPKTLRPETSSSGASASRYHVLYASSTIPSMPQLVTWMLLQDRSSLGGLHV